MLRVTVVVSDQIEFTPGAGRGALHACLCVCWSKALTPEVLKVWWGCPTRHVRGKQVHLISD